MVQVFGTRFLHTSETFILLRLFAKLLRVICFCNSVSGQLFFGKIITIVATRGQILRLKCTKFCFGWGSAPDPARGAYNAPRLLAGFKGPTSKGREATRGKGKGGRGRKGTGWEVSEREGPDRGV